MKRFELLYKHLLANILLTLGFFSTYPFKLSTNIIIVTEVLIFILFLGLIILFSSKVLNGYVGYSYLFYSFLTGMASGVYLLNRVEGIELASVIIIVSVFILLLLLIDTIYIYSKLKRLYILVVLLSLIGLGFIIFNYLDTKYLYDVYFFLSLLFILCLSLLFIKKFGVNIVLSLSYSFAMLLAVGAAVAIISGGDSLSNLSSGTIDKNEDNKQT